MPHCTRKYKCWIPQPSASENTGSLTVIVEADEADLEFWVAVWGAGRWVRQTDVVTRAIPERPTAASAAALFRGLQVGEYDVYLDAASDRVMDRAMQPVKVSSDRVIDRAMQPVKVSLGRTAKAIFKSAIPGSLKIDLSAKPPTAGKTFTFTITSEFSSQVVTLTTTGQDSITSVIDNLYPRTYTVTRNYDKDWTGPSEVQVQVQSGKQATATFDLIQSAELTIYKKITNYSEGGDATFTFRIPDMPDISITTSGGEGKTTVSVPHTVTYVDELPIDGWKKVDRQIIYLWPGGKESVTFTNTQLAELIIEVKSFGGNDTFTWLLTDKDDKGTEIEIPTSDGYGTLSMYILPGLYKLTENEKTGWKPPTTAEISFSAAGGSTYSYEFEKYKYAKVTVLKTIGNYAQAQDGTFDFTGDLGTFTITTETGTGSAEFSQVEAGDYDIEETQIDGWRIPSQQTITVAWGDEQKVYFTNIGVGSINISYVTGGSNAFTKGFGFIVKVVDSKANEVANITGSASFSEGDITFTPTTSPIPDLLPGVYTFEVTVSPDSVAASTLPPVKVAFNEATEVSIIFTKQ